MKRATKVIIVMSLVLVLGLSMIACTNNGNSMSGKDGKSAYDLAVENGFTGTVEEWLESLHGSNGLNGLDGKDANTITPESLLAMYKDAQTEGFTGSYVEFLKQLGIDTTGIISSGDSTSAVNSAARSVVSINAFKDATMKSGAAGAGVIYKLDKKAGRALIITNYHVVYMRNEVTGVSQNIFVSLYGEEVKEGLIPAKYIGGSEYYDIAVLEVKDSERLKNSNAQAVVVETNPILVGGTAIAIGNPQGTGISVTKGIISKESEYIPITSPSGKQIKAMRVMRIDTLVNSGNSGGGLFNDKGHLIGIVNAKSIERGIDGVNYAIPLDIVLGVANNIIATCNGDVTRLMIGKLGCLVTLADSHLVPVEIDGKTFYRTKETVKVQNVYPSYLAETMGLLVDDEIVKATLDGVDYEVDRMFTLNTVLLNVRANSTLSITVKRANAEGIVETVTLSTTIKEGDLVEADVDKFQNQLG